MTEHEANVDAFLAKLKTSLMAPDHGDGGSWPEISSDDLTAMDDLFEEAMRLKWAEDCDGDQPVRLLMAFRRRHRLLYTAIQHVADEAPEVRERMLLDNIRMLSSGIAAHGNELGMAQRQLDEMARERRCLTAVIPMVLVEYSRPDVWADTNLQRDIAVSLHASPGDADAFAAPEGMTKRRQSPVWLIPKPFANETDNFAEFRKLVKSLTDDVMPQFSKLNKEALRIRHSDPLTSKSAR